jgi:signal transduction histidine kinase
MSSGGTLRIKTTTHEGHVILAIQDEGEGIKPDVLEKIGTPFFTTKKDGTGLGLGICYGIAARHNAQIDFDTSPNGTTFYVKFSIGKNEGISS